MKNFLCAILLMINFQVEAQVKIIWDTIDSGQDGKYILKNDTQFNNQIIVEQYDTKGNLFKKMNFKCYVQTIKGSELLSLVENNKLILNGEYIEYYPNKDTLFFVRFKEGVKINKQVKFEIGNIISEVLEISDAKNAKFYKYYKNGNIQLEFPLLNNLKTGKEIHYYENGNKWIIANYDNNKLTKKLTEYYQNGNVKREEFYNSDILMKGRCMDEYGEKTSCSKLIDSLKAEFNIEESISKLKLDEEIEHYLENYKVKFTCEISIDGKIMNLQSLELPNSFMPKIDKWLNTNTKWRTELFNGKFQKATVEFVISNSTKDYIVVKKDYNSELNNHWYNPIYEFRQENGDNISGMEIIKRENDNCDYCDGSPLIMCEEMPTFMGEKLDISLPKFFQRHTIYPSESYNKGIEGSVFVKFVIDTLGNICSPIILKGLNYQIDNEVMRVIYTVPKIKPGKQRGKNICVLYTLPLNFSINDKASNGNVSKNINNQGNTATFLNNNPHISGYNYIYENLKNPQNFNKKLLPENCEVYVRVMIDQNGYVKDPTIIRSFAPDFDSEVIKVMLSMPKWEPAQKNGKNTNVYYTFLVDFNHIPVKYKLIDLSQISSTETEDSIIEVDIMPLFRGEKPEVSVRDYIGRNTKYPIEAAEKNIQGKVYVKFDVNSEGEVENVRVVRSVHPLLDAEAIRVFETMPKWEPAQQKGKVVSVTYTFPVNFILTQ